MHAEIAQHLTSELTNIHERIAHLSRWRHDARTAEILEGLEERAEELQDALALQMEMALEPMPMSDALGAAISAAQTSGTAIVSHPVTLGRELVRHVPGCHTRTGTTHVWIVAVDGGEIRLTHKAGAVRGVMTWRDAR